MKEHLMALTLGLTLILTGCATSINLSPQQRQNVKSITINSNIPVPHDMYYMGDTERATIFLGVIGGIAEAAIDDNKSKKLILLARKNNIDIRQIVKIAFINQINQRKLFNLVEAHGDAQLNIIIKMYGLSVPVGFSMKLTPVLAVIANMTNQHNQIIWQKEKLINVDRNMPTYNAQEIKANPALLKKMWTAASVQIAAETLQSLNIAR